MVLLMTKNVVHDISYANSVQSALGRVVVRTIENLTGRIGLIKRAADYDLEITGSGKNFWQVIAERYRIDFHFVSGCIDSIPRDEPLIVVANHPYGILDGLALGYILSKTRDDFRILANSVFKNSKELDQSILPISFCNTKEALKQNIHTRNYALNYLSEGGCIGIFPGGTVSTSLKPFGKAMDPNWRRFTAKLISRSGANVLPIFFYGSNSRLFQIASHLHVNLRMALLIREFKKRIDNKVMISIGKILSNDELQNHKSDVSAMMKFLRFKTYELSRDPGQVFDLGFEFDI